MRASPPRVLFVGSMYAGHRTRFLNLEAHSRHDPRIRPTYRRVTGWVDSGTIERLPGLPAGLKGRVRATLEAAAIAALPRPDVIWTAIGEVATPHLWAQLGPLRRPVVLDLDWTPEQKEQLAPFYFGRSPRHGLRARLAQAQAHALWRTVTLFTPWSNWAADSLRRNGIPDERIRVVPPGVDLEQWKPPASPREACPPGAKLRLLFVGGDFQRKGGRVLLDVFTARFAEHCELDVVTREPLPTRPGVHVHRAEPNSPQLRELYARAHLFVLPSRAECFGIATVEAMACGLPVIVGDVGGVRDIGDDGVTGWLIEPTKTGLARALDYALAQREALPAMGRRGRAVAEARFDGKRNDALIVDLLLCEADRARRTSRA